MRIPLEGYVVESAGGAVVAIVTTSYLLAVVVATVLADLGEVFVDAPAYGDDGEWASWRVTEDKDLGVPVFHRLDAARARVRAQQWTDGERPADVDVRRPASACQTPPDAIDTWTGPDARAILPAMRILFKIGDTKRFRQ